MKWEKRAVAEAAEDWPDQPPAVPNLFGGQRIAWNSSATWIIASAGTLRDCAASAAAAGETDPQFEKVPRPDIRILGMAR